MLQHIENNKLPILDSLISLNLYDLIQINFIKFEKL